MHIKKILFGILFCCSFQLYSQSVVTVSPENRFQTVEGWGVSLAWWTNSNYTGNWSSSTLDMLAKAAVQDLNYNVFRFSIGGGENPDYPVNTASLDGRVMPGYRTTPQADGEGWGVNDLSNDFGQINMLNRIATYRAPYNDIITEMISYSAPWWMTYSGTTSGAVDPKNENLKTEFYDDFADYLASVTKDLRVLYPNWNIKYIEPFNEPLSGYWKAGGKQDGMQVYVPTQAKVLKHLKERLSAYEISDVKLTAADNSKVYTSLSNMTEMKNNHYSEFTELSKISTHSYGGSWQDKANLATFAETNNIPVWQTETGPLSWSPSTKDKPGWWARHYDMSYRLIEDMRNLKATVWCDWQLMSIDDGWGLFQHTDFDYNNPTREGNIKKTKSFYCRKNVTNFIKQGYTIIETSNGNTLGAISPDGSEVVLVVVNSEGNPGLPIQFRFDLSKLNGVRSFKTYRTTGTDIDNGENCQEKTINSVDEKGVLTDNSIVYTAPPYSITTFKIVLDGNTSSLSDNQNKALTSANSGDDLKLYPNPLKVGGKLTVHKNHSEAVNLCVLDLMGRQLFKEHIQEDKKSIDIDNNVFSKGIFLFRFTNEQGKLLACKKLLCE